MNVRSKLRNFFGIIGASILALGSSDVAQAAPPDPNATPSSVVPNATSGASSPTTLKHFVLSCNGVGPIAFKEASGLDHDSMAVEKLNATAYAHKGTGVSKAMTIELKSGEASGAGELQSLYKWREMVVRGDLVHAQKDCELTAKSDGVTVLRYALRHAYPTSWKGPALENKSTAAQSTELTLRLEGLTKLK